MDVPNGTVAPPQDRSNVMHEFGPALLHDGHHRNIDDSTNGGQIVNYYTFPEISFIDEPNDKVLSGVEPRMDTNTDDRNNGRGTTDDRNNGRGTIERVHRTQGNAKKNASLLLAGGIFKRSLNSLGENHNHVVEALCPTVFHADNGGLTLKHPPNVVIPAALLACLSGHTDEKLVQCNLQAIVDLRSSSVQDRATVFKNVRKELFQRPENRGYKLNDDLMELLEKSTPKWPGLQSEHELKELLRVSEEYNPTTGRNINAKKRTRDSTQTQIPRPPPPNPRIPPPPPPNPPRQDLVDLVEAELEDPDDALSVVDALIRELGDIEARRLALPNAKNAKMLKLRVKQMARWMNIALAAP